jgi:pimeloyl-ACP methyl ester carboxylesterase
MRLLKITFFSLLALVGLSAITYFAGPRASYEPVTTTLPELNLTLEELDGWLAARESDTRIKPENESRIVWADSVRQTEYVLVYLHGFSAGVMEGHPIHMETAKRYGMNLYLPRLSCHGLDDKDAFLEVTPKSLMESALEAMVIGKMLGKKIILMSCSTGSTLGIYITAHYPDLVDAHVMYSPNIALANPTGKLLTGPWGLQIARKVVGDYKTWTPEPDKSDSAIAKIRQFWSDTYNVEGIVALQSLIDQTMTKEIFEKVTTPFFMGYYYASDTAQDQTVSVKAMLEFDKMTRTPEAKKRLVVFPKAGAHVIAHPLTSKEFDRVREETHDYIENVIGLVPIKE